MRNCGDVSMANSRRYHPLVVDDLASATSHYDDISRPLGSRFRDAVRLRLEMVTRNPESFTRIHNELRVALVDRFPYVIVYELIGEIVFISGIFHAHSEQKSWFERLP